MNRLIVLLIVILVLVFLEWYVFQAVRYISSAFSPVWRKTTTFVYWALTIGTIASILLLVFGSFFQAATLRNFLLTFIVANLLVKLVASVFLFVDDLVRLGKWVTRLLTKPDAPDSGTIGTPITRSEFLVKTAMIAGSIPLVGMGYGVLIGAHDYRVRRITLNIPNLPKSFEGLRIAQLSDIHSGSFYNRTAMKDGVDLLLREKPDVAFFTGDLVNNVASEISDYISVFEKVKAPLGVYSTLGNHDYGDYVNWPSLQAKRQNLENLKAAHGQMGWNLLMNENRILTQNGDKLAIIGVENWGARGNFPKYGKLAQAHQGTQEASVKLLLSHDPSHWDAQVRPEYPDINAMFAGHTHGMQFGVEAGNLKWSPVQYMYDQWAGLYQKESQYLYVNRGYGYIGFPGRIGMPPEITIFELRRG